MIGLALTAAILLQEPPCPFPGENNNSACTSWMLPPVYALSPTRMDEACDPKDKPPIGYVCKEKLQAAIPWSGSCVGYQGCIIITPAMLDSFTPKRDAP